MCVICEYESKEGILGNYILQFATFRLTTRLLESPYLSLYDIKRSATMGDIILFGEFNARTIFNARGCSWRSYGRRGLCYN